jgi:hypothetical protein
VTSPTGPLAVAASLVIAKSHPPGRDRQQPRLDGSSGRVTRAGAPLYKTPRRLTHTQSTRSSTARDRELEKAIASKSTGAQEPNRRQESTARPVRASMVTAIAVASAGLGMLAGVAMANRSSPPSAGAALWRPGGGPALRWGGGAPRCEACGGSGKEDCRLCARWSDAGARGKKISRSGCGACAGTRRTPCRCCGGSGTGRRAPVRIATSARTAPTGR